VTKSLDNAKITSVKCYLKFYCKFLFCAPPISKLLVHYDKVKVKL